MEKANDEGSCSGILRDVFENESRVVIFLYVECIKKGMKTHLVMYFGTKGMRASEIAAALEKLGFETHYGPYDFSYNWGKREPSKQDVLKLGDKVHDALKDSGAVFNLDTHD